MAVKDLTLRVARLEQHRQVTMPTHIEIIAVSRDARGELVKVPAFTLKVPTHARA